MKKEVILNERFGRLIVTEDLGTRLTKRGKTTFVKAICDCGNTHILEYRSLLKGYTKSCGCFRKERGKIHVIQNLFKHGLSNHPLVGIWSSLIQRCYNYNNKNYQNYGGRGVIVCEEWRNDFKSFHDWAMINGWAKGMELDKDINGNGLLYGPDTCSFVSKRINNRHKRNNVMLSFNGVSKCITEWAQEYGIKLNTLKGRLKRGWTIEEALNTPKITKYADRIKTC